MAILSDYDMGTYGDLSDIAEKYTDVEASILDTKETDWWLPFTKFLDKTKTEGATNMTYYWVLADENPLVITLYSQSTTNTFEVASSADIKGLHEGDLLYSTDAGAAEFMIVGAVTPSASANASAFLAYNYAGTNYASTGSSYSEGDKLYVSGISQPEGGRAGRVVYESTEAYNYLQSFSVQIEHSDFAHLTNDRIDNVRFQNDQALLQFLKRIELNSLLGERDTIAAAAAGASTDRIYEGAHYLTGGIRYFVPTANATSVAAGAFDMTAWRTFLQGVAHYGGGEKIMYCGLGLYDKIWGIYDTAGVQLTPNALTFNVFKIQEYGRILSIIPHPALIDAFSDVGYAFDPLYMKQKVALPISRRQVLPNGEYDKTIWKLKTIRGLKPMNTRTLHSLTIT